MTQTAKFDLVTDVYDTLGPTKDNAKATIKYMLGSEEVKSEIVDQLGPEYTNLEEVLEKGMEANSKGNKDSEEFRMMINASNIGSTIGYQRGELQFKLFEGSDDNVKEELQAISDAGGRIFVYSSGGVETTEASLKSIGIENLVGGYYSSSQEEIGSKFEARGYQKIAQKNGLEVASLAYVADTPKECEAAVEAGYGKVLLINRSAKEDQLGMHSDGYEVINNYNAVTEAILIPDNSTEVTATTEVSE